MQASSTNTSAFKLNDNVHLFTSRQFSRTAANGGISGVTYEGLANLGGIDCANANKSNSCGIDRVPTSSTLISHAMTVAHELGHNLNSVHDAQTSSAGAYCPSTGYIMQAVTDPLAPLPTTFSNCSQSQIYDWLQSSSHTGCLLTTSTTCG